jgi:hypothetical protein
MRESEAMWNQDSVRKRNLKARKIAGLLRFPDELMDELMREVSLAVAELGADETQLEQWLGVPIAKAA